MALPERITSKAKLKVEINLVKSEGHRLLLQGSFVALVLKHGLLAHSSPFHPHSDLGAVSLEGSDDQVEVVTPEPQLDLSLNEVILKEHSLQTFIFITILLHFFCIDSEIQFVLGVIYFANKLILIVLNFEFLSVLVHKTNSMLSIIFVWAIVF